MYSIRPYSSENVELDLPTTMYPIRPFIQQIKVNKTFCIYYRFNNSKRFDTGILNSYLVDLRCNCLVVGANN
jgi:hypothetical protein